MPIPNLVRAPKNAISSVQICPVLKKVTLSFPNLYWMHLHLSTNTVSAFSHSVAVHFPVARSRRYCVVARSGALSGVSASHPFGQALPRLTGYFRVGVTFTAWFPLICAVMLQPVEQNPQIRFTAASGINRFGNCPNAD